MAYQVLQITGEHITGPGNKAVNVFHVSGTDGTFGGVGAEAAANLAIASITSFYDDLISGGVIVADWTVGGDVKDLQSGGAPSFVPSSAQSTTSSMTGSYMPPQLAGVISWKTALAGRRYRGRTFLGPLVSACISGTGFSPPGVAQAQDAANALIANLASDDLVLTVLSQLADVATPVVSAYFDAIVDTLRSRAR